MGLLMRFFTVVNRVLYRLSGGKLGARAAGMPLLLLTTRGRKTGKERTVVLGYLEDGDALVVVGSHGGLPEHAAWYLNLQANPEVEVQIGKDKRRLRARRATPEEAERLWPVVLAASPGYGKYREKTSREIPLVLLEPSA
jgi:deazaflavin-dependent oxidoreductase (nitroreductase family)